MRLKEISIFLTLALSAQTRYYGSIKIISDFIVRLREPVKVNAYLCWPQEHKIQLWKELSLNNVSCDIGHDSKNITYHFPPEHQLFLIDTNCNGSHNILKQGNELSLFEHPFKWIILGSANNIIEEFYFRADSQIFLIEHEENGKEYNNYRIKALYKLFRDFSGFIQNDVAEWSLKDGFKQYNEFSFSKNRTDLRGTNLNITYVILNPDTFNHLEDYRDTHIEPLAKLNWLIMKNLLFILNATSTPVYQETWGYSRDGNTGRFTGMMGELQSGRSEIAGMALFMNMDRIGVIEYVSPSVSTCMKFIFRAPPLSYVSNVFTLPFDTDVWYSCFGLIPLIFITIYLIVKWEWKDPIFKENMRENNSVVPLRPGFVDVLLVELGAITQQGTESEPKSNAGRIATIFVFIAFMFLYTSYSANIVALLQSTTESIKTLEDLLNSRISLGAHDTVYMHHFFETAREPTRKAIYQQKIAPKGQTPNFLTIEEGIGRVRKDFFAFHVEVSPGYKMIGETFQESEKCSLKEIFFVELGDPWVCIKKRSAYKEIIKVALRKMLERGIQRRDINRLYTKKPVCQSRGSNFGSAGILDCYAAFLIFGTGAIFSCLLLVLEIMINKKIKAIEMKTVIISSRINNETE